MERRRFGTFDLAVPVICFGTMRFASKQRAADDASRAGKRALEAAITSTVVGINSVEHIDRVFAALDAPAPSGQFLPRLDAIHERLRAEYGVRADGADVPIDAPAA